jgi:hypothetical protein
MSLYVDEVPMVVSGEQAAAIWKALDKMAAGHPDGPYRAMLDRTSALVGRAVRDATFAEQARKADADVSRLIGERFIESIHAVGMGDEVADALDANVKARRAA